MTFIANDAPSPSVLQTMKEQIAKAAGVDVANVTLTVDSSSGSSKISANVAVNSSEAAGAAGSRLKSELGTAADASTAFGVSISEEPVVVSTLEPTAPPASVEITLRTPQAPEPSTLQAMKQKIATLAGVDVANVTLAVNGSSDGSSVITATVAVSSNDALAEVEEKLEGGLGTAADASATLGVTVAGVSSIVESPAGSTAAAPTSSPPTHLVSSRNGSRKRASNRRAAWCSSYIRRTAARCSSSRYDAPREQS